MRVSNADFAAGVVATAAALNEKFTDVATATTASLDDDNFAPESVDYQHFDLDALSGKSDVVLRGWALGDTGLGRTGGTDYASLEDGNPPEEVDHGSGSRASFGAAGQQLSPGDVLRVHWSVYVEDYTTYTAGLVTGALGLTPQPVWLGCRQWDITSSALANWTEVPGQTDFASAFGAGAEGGNTDDAQATLVIPHGHITNTAPATAYTHKQRPNAAHHRAWSYERPSNAAAVTVYGVRMVIAGLYHPSFATRTGSKNSFERDVASPGWSGEGVRIANARVLALIMRGD